MSLADIVNVTITTGTKTPTRTGFGLPLVAGYHTVFPERVRSYTSIASMITDGFTAIDPITLAATAALSQNPSPPRVIVGRCANTQAQVMKVYPHIAPLALTAYTLVLNGIDRTYTTDGSPTVAKICTGLAAALDPAAWTDTNVYDVGDYVKNDTGPVKDYICTIGGTSAGSGGPTGTGAAIVDGTVTWAHVGTNENVTVSDNTTFITVTADAVADQFQLYAQFFNYLRLLDETPNTGGSGIAEDIAAIQVENNDWYALITTNHGKAVITAAAAAIESQTKIYLATTLDYDVIEAGSGDIASTLQAAAYARTALSWHHRANDQFMGAAFGGKNLPQDPGSITWAYKTLAGVTASDLNDTQIGIIEGKDCNYYIELAGLNITLPGKVSDSEWIDVVRGIDWTEVRMQEAVFGLLANSKKVPFTDKGIGAVQGVVQGVLSEGVSNGLYSSDPAPTVLVPLAADVPTADKANRLLPDVEFTATLAGAIHKVEISGVVSV